MSPSTGGVHRAHRTEDGHHIRDAVAVVAEEKVEATEKVLRRLSDGTFDHSRTRRRLNVLPDAEALSAPREDTTGAFDRRGVGSGAASGAVAVEVVTEDRRRPLTDRRTEPDPRDRDGNEDPVIVHRRLERSRLMPGALALHCPEHGADAGQPCWGRIAGTPGSGVCGDRLARSLADRIPAPVAENRDWKRRQVERSRSSEHLRVRATDKGSEPWERGSKMTSWPPKEDAR